MCRGSSIEPKCKFIQIVFQMLMTDCTLMRTS